MLHTHAVSASCISMVHLHAASAYYCTLHLDAASACCTCLLRLHAAPACCTCMLHRASAWCICMLHLHAPYASCILRPAFCTLHSRPCICILDLHATFLHSAPCMLHVAYCMLHVACCMLHVACCMLHVACCMLYVACFMLHPISRDEKWYVCCIRSPGTRLCGKTTSGVKIFCGTRTRINRTRTIILLNWMQSAMAELSVLVAIHKLWHSWTVPEGTSPSAGTRTFRDSLLKAYPLDSLALVRRLVVKLFSIKPSGTYTGSIPPSTTFIALWIAACRKIASGQTYRMAVSSVGSMGTGVHQPHDLWGVPSDSPKQSITELEEPAS